MLGDENLYLYALFKKFCNFFCILVQQVQTMQFSLRHNRKHGIMPTNINYRANVWALKEEGCTHVIVSTACGSLQEEIAPGDLVILDQFIDR